MYNITFLCTYKLHDDEEDQDTLYRHEYLYAFGLKEYESDVIVATIDTIYEKIKDNKDFIEIAESHYNFKSENKNHETILQFLFSFHTFHLFHACLVYFLRDDKDDKDDAVLYNEFIKNKKSLIDEITKK
jgi:hypothetical protein